MAALKFLPLTPSHRCEARASTLVGCFPICPDHTTSGHSLGDMGGATATPGCGDAMAMTGCVRVDVALPRQKHGLCDLTALSGLPALHPRFWSEEQ